MQMSFRDSSDALDRMMNMVSACCQINCDSFCRQRQGRRSLGRRFMLVRTSWLLLLLAIPMPSPTQMMDTSSKSIVLIKQLQPLLIKISGYNKDIRSSQ